MFWNVLEYNTLGPVAGLTPPPVNYYSPQIFKSVGLASSSAGLFATGIYGVVKVVFTALGLMFGVEQAGRKVSQGGSLANTKTAILYGQVKY